MEKKYQSLSFGSIKEPKIVREDPFEGKAMLTLDIAPTSKGASSRVLLNKSGQELFGVVENEEYPITALFGKNEDGSYDVFLMTVEGVAFDEKTLYLLRKNKSISSKVFYNELVEVFKVTDTTKQNHLELVENTEILEYINNNIHQQGQDGKVLKAATVKLYVEDESDAVEKVAEVGNTPGPVETENNGQETF